MLQAEALKAIRSRGERAQVHVVADTDPRPLTAVDVRPIGDRLFIETRHFDGTKGPTLDVRKCRALERDHDD